MHPGALKGRIDVSLKSGVLSTDLSNPSVHPSIHPFIPSTLIGHLLCTSSALGPLDTAVNKPPFCPPRAHLLQR